jgi:hypothetical protein
MRNLERAWVSPAAKPNRERNRAKGREGGPQAQRAIGHINSFREARERVLGEIRAAYDPGSLSKIDLRMGNSESHDR